MQLGLTLASVNSHGNSSQTSERLSVPDRRPLNHPPMPLGVLYLAAACRRAGYDPDLKLIQRLDLSVPAIADALEDGNEVLGISAMSNSLPAVLLAVEQIKQRYPDKVILLGGAGTAFVEREMLARFPQVDAIVSGEGEETLVEVLEALSSGSGLAGIRGVHYRDGDGGIVSNPPRPLASDLDAIPFPAIELLPAPYSGKGVAVITSRGCPYRCVFCQTSRMWHHRSRLRQPEACLKEIEHDLAVLRGAERIAFVDDLFISSQSRARSFCRLLKSTAQIKQWGCLGRVKILTDELLAEMREAGCATIGFGIESGSNQVLARLNKGFTIEEAIETVAMAARHIPRLRIFFMWGFPFETYDDFMLTLIAQQKISEIVSKAGTTFEMSMHVMHPFAGTAIAEQYQEVTPLPLEGECGGMWALGGEVFEGEVRSLIRKHPTLFPIFYAVQHPELERKCRVAARLWEGVLQRQGDCH